MSLLLAIHSYPGANEALQRHWPRFMNVGADEIWTIGTEDGETWGRHWPTTNAGFDVPKKIGRNEYIWGDHLPNRLLDTFEVMLLTDHEWLMIAEYDTLFFAPLDLINAYCQAAAHLGGEYDICKFFHNPWLIHRDFAPHFIARGRQIVARGECGYNTRASSPDVFFGLICQELEQTVQDDLWTEFSRNSYDIPGHLDLARDAYRNGVNVIHGIKKKEELEFILS